MEVPPAVRLHEFADSFLPAQVQTTSLCADPSELAQAFRVTFEQLVPEACRP
ncbi:MAG: hypothetical protein AAGF11_36980 [Myxococcota bacterium]